MCDLLEKILHILGKMDWMALTQGIAGIWMAVVATIALNTWRRQIKAKKHVDFLDELTDTVHVLVLRRI